MIDIEIIPKEAAKELVKETASLTREIGGFFGKVFGTIPQDFVGVMGGDWLHEIRARNLYKLNLRTQKIREDRGLSDSKLKPLSPSEGLPLLRAAADESRPELQELWARLLANAMDPQIPQIMAVLINVIQGLDILEARIIQYLSDKDALNNDIMFIDHNSATDLRKDFRVSPDQFIITLNRMVDLKIISYNISMTFESEGEAIPDVYVETLDQYFEANLNNLVTPIAFNGWGAGLEPFLLRYGLDIYRLHVISMRKDRDRKDYTLQNVIGTIHMQTLGRELLRSLSLNHASAHPQSRSRRRAGPLSSQTAQRARGRVRQATGNSG